ncbi:hypothetical protein J14TS2_44830 [Bacillus sp. J14TS2]|uniref:DUF3310 domain-containing protein n=1 Tax=Bacillus sp. J14TS2 TaxID=2807188 RepID=UPI001B2E6258|nr:DUF3310 domain-containing protein [Bacillus sp. J14TS2]GIN74008.1 hypothetical protein J14TS2_44830 [Bacillus sp. J14TS2]
MLGNKWTCEKCSRVYVSADWPEENCDTCGEYSWAADNDKPKDNVNHPSHYTAGQIEVIDYIKDKLTPGKYIGYCTGNVLKYVSRYDHKNGVEDLEKAAVYLKWAIEVLKDEPDHN